MPSCQTEPSAVVVKFRQGAHEWVVTEKWKKKQHTCDWVMSCHILWWWAFSFLRTFASSSTKTWRLPTTLQNNTAYPQKNIYTSAKWCVLCKQDISMVVGGRNTFVRGKWLKYLACWLLSSVFKTLRGLRTESRVIRNTLQHTSPQCNTLQHTATYTVRMTHMSRVIWIIQGRVLQCYSECCGVL